MGLIKTLLYIVFVGIALTRCAADYRARSVAKDTIATMRISDIYGCANLGSLSQVKSQSRYASAHLITPMSDLMVYKDDLDRFYNGDALLGCTAPTKKLKLVCRAQDINEGVANKCAQLIRLEESKR